MTSGTSDIQHRTHRVGAEGKESHQKSLACSYDRLGSYFARKAEVCCIFSRFVSLLRSVRKIYSESPNFGSQPVPVNFIHSRDFFTGKSTGHVARHLVRCTTEKLSIERSGNILRSTTGILRISVQKRRCTNRLLRRRLHRRQRRLHRRQNKGVLPHKCLLGYTGVAKLLFAIAR